MNQVRAFSSHTALAFAEASLIAVIVLALIVAPALAAKGGGGGKGGGGKPPGGGSSTLTLVLVDDRNANQLPNWADTVTFEITTTQTDKPFVSLKCYQGGALVYSAVAGFYPDYPWPGAQLMPLESPSWTGGAAECTAVLNSKLATMHFRAEG